MKRHLTGLLTLAASLLLAASARAQSPASTPTPPPPGEIYPSNQYSYADRLAAAQAVAGNPHASNEDVAKATQAASDLTAMIAHTTLDAVDRTTWATVGAPLAKQILDAQGRLTPLTSPAQAADLVRKAHFKIATAGQPNPAAVLAYLRPLLATYPGEFPFHYAVNALGLARDQIASGRLNDALTTASDPVIFTTNQWRNQIGVIADIKSRQRSPEALSWAKLVYLLSDFGDTQDGIRAVTTALRSLDMSLTRANAFIAAQTDASLPNLLKDVPLPDAYKAGLPAPLDAQAPLVDQVIRGDLKGSLTVAMMSFVQAGNNNDLNAAVANVGRSLRDADLNLVRANGFVEAQKQGASYPIAELQ